MTHSWKILICVIQRLKLRLHAFINTFFLSLLISHEFQFNLNQTIHQLSFAQSIRISNYYDRFYLLLSFPRLIPQYNYTIYSYAIKSYTNLELNFEFFARILEVY